MRFGADEMAQPSAMRKDQPATMSEALTHFTRLDRFAEGVTMVFAPLMRRPQVAVTASAKYDRAAPDSCTRQFHRHAISIITNLSGA